MKYSFIFITFLLFISNIVSAQSLDWVNTMGGVGNDFDVSATTDIFGNVFVTGSFSDTVDFDPGPGTLNLVSNGSKDYYIQKLDQNGALLWAHSFGGPGYDLGWSLVTDSNGNVYVTGAFEGSVDFDPGPGVVNLSAGKGIFVQKFDSLGNLLWAKGANSTYSIFPKDIAIDQSDNLYITGGFRGSASFFSGSSGIGVSSYASTLFGAFQDIFIFKIDSAGNEIWLKHFGDDYSYSYGESVTTDALGHVYATGYFNSTIDFDPGPGNYNLTALGTSDTYILKLDSSSNFIFAKSIGNTGYTRAHSIAVDSLSNIYFTGGFSGSADFDPGPGTYLKTSAGLYDFFIQKMDSSGKFTWVNTAGNVSNDFSQKVCLDNSGGVYVTGVFSNTVDFNNGPGINNVVSSGSLGDAFIHKIDTSGNFLWVRSLERNPLSSGNYGSSINVNSNGEIFTSGVFHGTVDFDIGPGQLNILSNGLSDNYVLKLNQDSCSNLAITVDSISHITCSDSGYLSIQPLNGIPPYSFEWNTLPLSFDSNITVSQPGLYTCTITDGNNCERSTSFLINSQYTNTSQDMLICQGDSLFIGGAYQKTAGLYSDTLPSSTLCDSIVITNLIVNVSYSSTVVNTCDSFLSPAGNTYITTGTYHDTISNYLSCDSIITTYLTINNSSSSTISPVACGSYLSPSSNYTWTTSNVYMDTIPNVNNCDSVITINLTINNSTSGVDTIIACDSYLWIDNIAYSSNNTTATHTLIGGNANGCDSIVTLDLTIINVDISTNNSNDSILSTATSATYQWLDCNNNYSIILGETDALFIASTNGNYAVQVTQNSCIDTSSCIQVTNVGLNEVMHELGIIIYPNPSTGQFTIEKPSDLNKAVQVKLLDATSKLILEKVIPIDNQKVEMDIRNYSKGIYYLQLIVDNEIFVKQILKN